MKTYICKPISWFSTHQYAAWWLVDYSRHLQSRRSHASLPFWNNSFPKYRVGVSAELKISFLWKYEKCFLCTFRIRIRILISLRVLWESHPLTACACLHTSLLPYYALMMWTPHKLAYKDISKIWCHVEWGCRLLCIYWLAYLVYILLWKGFLIK